MNSATFYGSCLGFLLGVLVATLTPLSWLFAGMLAVVSLALSVVHTVDKKVVLTRSETPVYLIAGVICLLVSIGIIRFTYHETHLIPEEVNTLSYNETHTIVGTISRDVVKKESSVRAVVETETVQTNTDVKNIKTKVLVTLPAHTTYRYGDVISLSGNVQKPEPFTTDAGRVFDYDQYLRKDGITATMYYPDTSRVEEGGGNAVTQFLFYVKQKLLNGINRVLPDPQAALAGGILLGVQSSLGDDLEDAFRTTGLIHIVVLSGYNVTLVAIAIIAFLKQLRVGLVPRSIIAIIAIALFAVLVGLGATVVRASIMAALVVLAHTIGRRAHMLRALAIASVLMVFVDPMILVFDPSFQLSAIATLGLITVSPVLSDLLGSLTNSFGLRDIVVATLATQIAVLPMILYSIGTFSLVALPVNMLALPAVAFAMLFGFLAGLAGIVSRSLALPFTAIAYLLLSFILGVVTFFDSLPFSHINVPPHPVWVPLTLYLTLGIILIYLYKRRGYHIGIPSLSDRLA